MTLRQLLFALTLGLSPLLATAQSDDAKAEPKPGSTLSVSIDGKPFTAPMRRIRFGGATFLTATQQKPERTVQFRLITDVPEKAPPAGEYLIVAREDFERKKRKELEALLTSAKAEGKVGYALIDMLEETKGAGMAFHVGESQQECKLVLTASDEKQIRGTFSGTLRGVYYKEKPAATVFGGLGRLTSKLEDKAFTAATGFQGDISEGPIRGGYKKQPNTDTITLTGGTFVINLQ